MFQNNDCNHSVDIMKDRKKSLHAEIEAVNNGGKSINAK